MSEQVSSHNGYPGKITITVDGQEVDVYDTGNMFDYLALRVKMRDRAAGDPLVRAQKGSLEEIFEHDWNLQPFLDRFIEDETAFNQNVITEAREYYQLRDAGNSGDMSAARAWNERLEERYLAPEFLLQNSQIFEVMAPWLEEGGLQPIELTI